MSHTIGFCLGWVLMAAGAVLAIISIDRRDRAVDPWRTPLREEQKKNTVYISYAGLALSLVGLYLAH